MIALLLCILLTLSVSPSLAQVTFDDNFECGSVGRVTRLESSTEDCEHYSIGGRFDPQNRFTPERYPSSRWFYFRICGVKDKTIKLDIDYNDSKRPFFSYDNVNFTRFGEEHTPILDSTITMRYQHDTVFIAYFPPYTLTRNYAKIEEWQSSTECLSFDIGQSKQNRPQRALVITQNPHEGLIPSSRRGITIKESEKEKKVIYIHGRIHPSETPSSWHLEALVDTLLGDSPTACTLREKAILYILPITNPDGVWEGLSRTTPSGVNLENNYNKRGRKEAQEVKNIKRLLTTLHKSAITPSLVLNMHSQSTPKVCYWIHSAQSTSRRYNLSQMLLGSLSAWENPYFDFEELSHSSLKEIFLEHYVFKLFEEQTTALTFETPYSFYHLDSEGKWVSIQNLRELGGLSLRSILEFIDFGDNSTIYNNIK